jgi:F-type H+-transporting ATPase subunit b
MEIDLFTFMAQLVNFLILVFLLNRFLFKPVTAAMDAREKKIADEMSAARQKNAEADELALRSRELLRIQEQDKEQVLKTAVLMAEDKKKKMLEEAEKEARAAAQAWREGLELEKQRYLDLLRKRSGGYAMLVAEKALKSLADEELVLRISSVFISRIKGLEDKKTAELSDKNKIGAFPPVVTAGIELSGPAKELISAAIRERFNYGGSVIFERGRPDLNGVELNVSGFKIAWTMREYLDELEGELENVWGNPEAKDRSPEFRLR